MNRSVMRAFFQGGVFLTVVAGLLILVSPRESAEFVVSVCTFGIGLTLMALVIGVNRMLR
ncbi:hypothetical protein G4Y79_06750 [Phototrophicus methaneseepsis]|uniref:Uncharacterized protein n=1 Tax=Phototrophicus methaneseepsis TaxID=2710758 RepID=A0A7S8IFY2_9CHLR|nr:hypothetical protein [Phototrophicus methaneseepsis]QPC84072.1 hypothetical protein G4Y79_06750 [Phototrophicus methaneseepsis]